MMEFGPPEADGVLVPFGFSPFGEPVLLKAGGIKGEELGLMSLIPPPGPLRRACPAESGRESSRVLKWRLFI